MRAIVSLTDRAGCERVGGLPLWSRMVRSLRQRGADPIELLVAPSLRPLLPEEGKGTDRDRAVIVELPTDDGEITCQDLLGRIPEGEDEIVIAPADRAVDLRIVEELLSRAGDLAVVDSSDSRGPGALLDAAPGTSGGRLVGPARVRRSWLSARTGPLREQLVMALERGSIEPLDIARMPTYASNLRRDLRPFWFPAPGDPQHRGARDLLLAATQKGALDIPAMFHAPIEKRAAWRLADTRITPNQITVVTNFIAFTATFLFATGRIGWGLAAALAVGVLDGVDGKLARLRLETSKLGELEHWFDFLYEWSWWAALAYHFSSSGALPSAWTAFGFLALAEIVDGIAKWVNLRTQGRTIDEMSRFDRMVRWIGGRRNVYVWLLTAGALFGKAPQIFALLPWLEGATAVVHTLRVAWLTVARRPADGGGRIDTGGTTP